MRLICNIYLLLRHAGLPQGLIATTELASSCRPAPQQTLDRYRNAAGNFLGYSRRGRRRTTGVSRTLRSHLANSLPSAKPFSRGDPFLHPVQPVTFFAQTLRSCIDSGSVMLILSKRSVVATICPTHRTV